MTPNELYKTILRTLTQVRNVRAERITGLPVEGLCATDKTLDDMARNAAQALIGLLDKHLSTEDVKLAFWKTFHKSGEIFFSYHDGYGANHEAATNEQWEEFARNLPGHAKDVADAEPR